MNIIIIIIYYYFIIIIYYIIKIIIGKRNAFLVKLSIHVFVNLKS